MPVNPIGYFKLWRELLTKPIWLKSSPEQKTILIALLSMANFNSRRWEWKGEEFDVKPGQFITSINSIVECCGKGVTPQNVRTALKRFEKLGFLTNESTKSGRLVTIENWSLYQSEEKNQQSIQPLPNKDLTKSQQRPNKDLTPKEELKNLRIKELYVLPTTDNSPTLAFGESIYMSEAEYEFLVDRFGEGDAMQKIFDLDRHKESSGRMFESDFRAILDRAGLVIAE